jgi:hypothetical protein
MSQTMKLLSPAFLILGLILLSSRSSADDCSASAEAIPICTIVADAAKYDGKQILVKAIWRAAIHGSILTGPTCLDVGINSRKAENSHAEKQALKTIHSLTKKDQFHSVEIVARGTFRKAYSGTCFGPNCLGYEFVVSELLCASDSKADTADAKR